MEQEPGRFSEREQVLRQVGLKFYAEAIKNFTMQRKRKLHTLDDQHAEGPYQNAQLIEFAKSDGQTAEYPTNISNLYCDVTMRDASPNLVEFTYYSFNDTEKMILPNDFFDSYLIRSDGVILAAEHGKYTGIDTDHLGLEITPIEINPEELLHKIDTEFQPAQTLGT